MKIIFFMKKLFIKIISIILWKYPDFSTYLSFLSIFWKKFLKINLETKNFNTFCFEKFQIFSPNFWNFFLNFKKTIFLFFFENSSIFIFLSLNFFFEFFFSDHWFSSTRRFAANHPCSVCMRKDGNGVHGRHTGSHQKMEYSQGRWLWSALRTAKRTNCVQV